MLADSPWSEETFPQTLMSGGNWTILVFLEMKGGPLNSSPESAFERNSLSCKKIWALNSGK